MRQSSTIQLHHSCAVVGQIFAMRKPEMHSKKCHSIAADNSARKTIRHVLFNILACTCIA